MPRRANPVIEEILRQGRGQPRRRVLAALTTGRVESNFQNLPGGDADSQGWRQERASLYRDPRNLSASVRRFYQEAAKLDRGQKVGELAADVQRPAAQYRGRYAEHIGEARKLLGGGGGGGGGGASTSSITTRTPGVDRSRERAQLLQSFLDDEGGDRNLVDFALQMRGLRNTPGSSSTRTVRSGGGGGRGGGAPAHGSQIKELFWQGPGGINIKNGQRVPQGFVSGHADHVHVAAGPKTVDRFGRMAQRMGLHVGENPDFGGVAPVHTQGSYHYRNQAIDVSGDPAKERRFAKRVARYQRRRGR